MEKEIIFKKDENLQEDSLIMRKKNLIKEAVDMFIKKFGSPYSSFIGFAKLNRGDAQNIGHKISFDEPKIRELTEDQIERHAAHEVQHSRTNYLMELGRSEESKFELRALDDIKEFQELKQRIENFYETNKDKLKQPKEYYLEDLREILSRLRAYQIYLTQKRKDINITTLPYELIEVFREKDLKFLDENYLREISKGYERRVTHLKLHTNK